MTRRRAARQFAAGFRLETLLLALQPTAPPSAAQILRRALWKRFGKQLSFATTSFWRSRDGEQDPRRPAHVEGPRRKSFGFKRKGRHLARRSNFRVTQERYVHQATAYVFSDSISIWGNPCPVQRDSNIFKASGRGIVQKASLTFQKSVNARCLDCEFNGNSGFTSA